eukprot:1142653-Pelagomonas_calceolata.AAC.3
MPFLSSTLLDLLAPDTFLRIPLNSRHQDQAWACKSVILVKGVYSALAPSNLFLIDVGSVFTACIIWLQLLMPVGNVSPAAKQPGSWAVGRTM